MREIFGREEIALDVKVCPEHVHLEAGQVGQRLEQVDLKFSQGEITNLQLQRLEHDAVGNGALVLLQLGDGQVFQMIFSRLQNRLDGVAGLQGEVVVAGAQSDAADLLETVFVGDAVVPETVPPDCVKVSHLLRLLQDVEDSVESFLGVEVRVHFGDQIVITIKGGIGNSIDILFRIFDSNLESFQVFEPNRFFEPSETAARDEEQ